MARVAGSSIRRSSGRIRAGKRLDVSLPIVGKVRLPPPEQLVFYGVLVTLAAAGIVDWPVALIVATGHALAENRHNRIVREFGEALERA